jgi:hypothetical protein
MDVQQVAALAIVALAAMSLARRYWPSAKKPDEGGCPGCGDCGRPPATDVPKATPLITLGPSPRRRPNEDAPPPR